MLVLDRIDLKMVISQSAMHRVARVAVRGVWKKIVIDPSDKYSDRRRFSSSIPLNMNPSNRGQAGTMLIAKLTR